MSFEALWHVCQRKNIHSFIHSFIHSVKSNNKHDIHHPWLQQNTEWRHSGTDLPRLFWKTAVKRGVVAIIINTTVHLRYERCCTSKG